MSKNTNIIKINGQHYDANSGLPLHAPKTALISDVRPVNAPQKHLSRKPASNIRSHAPQSSKTLMRGPLKKPNLVQDKSTVSNKAKSHIMPKLSINGFSQERLKHANKVPKSKLISHFNGDNFVSSHAEPIMITPTAKLVSEISNARLNPEYRPDFLEAAIDRATSHEQPPHKLKRSKKKIARNAGISVGIMILVGIVGYQNINNIQIRMAGSRAGFAASLPSYQASGFGLSQIRTNAGEVALNFKDKNNVNKNYVVQEKPSSWDSLALRDNFVSVTDNKSRTLQSNGMAIYLYGDNNATWVNGGIWYLVSGNGTLSDNQIINLANSL